MKKIWTLITCALMAASLTFAQEESDDFNEQAFEPEVEQEEAPAQEEESKQEPSEDVQSNTQADNSQTAIENNPAREQEEAAAAEQSENRRAKEKRFGVGIRAAFDYGMMYGFSEEDEDAEYNPKGFGFEGGLALRISMIPHLYFAPEFNIAYMTTSHKYLEEYDRTYKSLDLEIPLLIRGVVAEKFYVTAGPQLVIALQSDSDIDPIKNGVLGINVETHETVDQAKFSFGLAAGAGFSFIEGLFIDARIYMGLKELYPDVQSLEDTENFLEEEYSIIDMKGAKMMKFKVGLSYWFM